MAKRGTEWLDWQTELLIKHFPDKRNRELAALIGRDICSIAHKAHQLKLKKSAEFLASPNSGRLQESPIGTEYTHRSGYLMRKINNNLPLRDRWKAVHIIEWEEHHGPVPSNYLVTFKDADKKNIGIENLELISRQQLLLHNTIHRYPKEVIGLIRLHRKFEREIKENG